MPRSSRVRPSLSYVHPLDVDITRPFDAGVTRRRHVGSASAHLVSLSFSRPPSNLASPTPKMATGSCAPENVMPSWP
jgi:hypothetical protein